MCLSTRASAVFSAKDSEGSPGLVSPPEQSSHEAQGSFTLPPASLRQSTALIDFAWGDPEMHCGSVRQISSVAYVKSWQRRVHKDYSSVRQTRPQAAGGERQTYSQDRLNRDQDTSIKTKTRPRLRPRLSQD